MKAFSISHLRGFFWPQIVTWSFLAVVFPLPAAVIWSGPTITYTQPAPDPTQAANQDRITRDVWLTRVNSKGLFNAFYETNATALSPTNTEWAFGALTNCTSLQYTNWLTWLNGQSPVTLIGQPVVVHLISDDIYISMQFTAWASGGSGGFAYVRSTPAPPVLSGTRTGNGWFVLNCPAANGFNYVLQTSTNLTDWTSLMTNSTVANSLQFSNRLNPAGAFFYRVERQ